MTNDLQNFYLYLKQQERSSKTMQSFFKEGSKNYKWHKNWEEHYSKCAFTLWSYCQNYKTLNKELNTIKLALDK